MRCLIGDFLPLHEVSLLAGSSGAGKTTLLMQLCAQLQRGEAPFGYPATPSLTLAYLAADRSWAAYEHTAKLIGLDLAHLPSRALVNDPHLDVSEFERSPLPMLMGLLDSFGSVDLIIVDPLIAFLGVDLTKYHLVVGKLLRLNRWCADHHVTLLGTHHTNKMRQDAKYLRPQDRLSGSSGLQGFTSSQLTLLPPAETGHPFTEWHIISHHAAPECHWLSRDDRGLFHRLSATERATWQALGTTGLAILRAVPATRAELRQHCATIPVRTLDATLARLVSLGCLARVGGRYVRTN